MPYCHFPQYKICPLTNSVFDYLLSHIEVPHAFREPYTSLRRRDDHCHMEYIERRLDWKHSRALLNSRPSPLTRPKAMLSVNTKRGVRTLYGKLLNRCALLSTSAQGLVDSSSQAHVYIRSTQALVRVTSLHSQ